MDYFIGWDVGTWKCTNGNKKSCDALVLMDETGILGHHRDNVSASIARVMLAGSVKAAELIDAWFERCGTEKRHSPKDHYYVAIDTPLGWPKGFVELLKGGFPENWKYEPNLQNSLLFRRTERELESGFSVVTHSIGNQSTKGMALLHALEAKHQTWGVWQKDNVTLFETYPKACLLSKQFVQWMAQQPCDYDIRQWCIPAGKKTKQKPEEVTTQDDTFDAAVCACLAKAFAKEPDMLCHPGKDNDEEKSEGWIFYPAGELIDKDLANKHTALTNSTSVASFAKAVSAFQDHIRSNEAKKAKPKAPKTARK